MHVLYHVESCFIMKARGRGKRKREGPHDTPENKGRHSHMARRHSQEARWTGGALRGRGDSKHRGPGVACASLGPKEASVAAAVLRGR